MYFFSENGNRVVYSLLPVQKLLLIQCTKSGDGFQNKAFCNGSFKHDHFVSNKNKICN